MQLYLETLGNQTLLLHLKMLKIGTVRAAPAEYGVGAGEEAAPENVW